MSATPATAVPDSRLGGAKAWLVWAVAVAFVIYLLGFQSGYSIVNPNIKEDVGLTVAQIGLIAATYTWSFAVFQLFSGALLDRLGARNVIPVGIAIFTAGVFFFAQAHSFTTIVVAQLILALGACTGFVGAGYVGGQWFGMARFSFMFGLVQCLASLFSAFSQNLLSIALKSFEWRQLLTWTGVAGILLCALAILCIREPAHRLITQHRQGFREITRDVFSSTAQVALCGHVWIAAAFGGFVFGAFLASGVIWAPKLMLARGLPPDVANLAASTLWLGLAAGCLFIPWWSDAIRRRKPPVIAGISLQLSALVALVYVPELSASTSMVLWFAFGVGAASHMLAFSTAGEVVKAEQIGTSAAIVNGTMFLVSGFLIARPGTIAGSIGAGTGVTLDVVAAAARPLLLALAVALALALLIRESYPRGPVATLAT